KRFLEDPYAGLVANRPDLFRGGHILDVGANVGYDTVLFAKALSPGARVIALEPERENCRRLQGVVEGSASSDRTTVHRLAGGAHRRQPRPGGRAGAAAGDPAGIRRFGRAAPGLLQGPLLPRLRYRSPRPRAHRRRRPARDAAGRLSGRDPDPAGRRGPLAPS